MKRFRYLLFFYVIVLAGCDRQSAYERLLLEADSLMEQHTDSALRLLESIPDVTDKGNEASRAYYILLLTQARYKCYQPVPADSLMRSAVRYYEQSGNPSMLCRAYYYLAMPLYEQGQHEEALLLLKKGEELAVKNHNLLYMSKYHESLCMVNSSTKYDEMMLHYAKLALRENRQLVDTTAIIRNLSQISTALYRLGRQKESEDSIYKILPLLHQMNTVSKSYILTNIGCSMHTTGNLESARKYLEESLRINPMSHTYAELGDVLADMNNMQEAERNWEEALKTSDSQTVLNVLASMQKRYEQQQDYQSAINISNRVHQINDSLTQASEQATLAEIQHKYDRQVVENKYYRTLTWLFALAFGTLAIIILMIGYHHYAVQKYVSKLTISRLEVEQATQEIKRLENSDMEQTREVKKLKRKIAKIRLHDFEQIGHGKEVFESVMANNPIKYLEDEESLIEYYSIFHHDTFSQWMDTYKNLTTRPIVYLILSDIGKSDDEIQVILGISNGAIRVMKSRLNAKKV
ncbi:MAG: hypothetical protein J6I37_05430 [Prevotella sp.]|nr:hypothetical protein [Prevotella sp.]